MTRKDLYWLAGLLEGEGSFMKGCPSKPNQVCVAVAMTDEDVIARVAGLFGMAYNKVGQRRAIERGWKVPYYTQLRGRKAVALMKLLKPLMGKRRQSQIQKVLDSYDPNYGRKLSVEKANKIRKRRNENVSDLATEYGVSKWMIYAIWQGRAYA